jgi:predicted nucleotidyltransferase
MRPMAPTQLDDVLALAGEVLGDDIAGAYLHGSAVLGGLRPTSDLDLLVVSRRSLGDDARRALTAGLLGVSGTGRRRPDDRPVELVVVVADDVRPWRYPPVVDYLYGQWLRDDYLGGMVPERRASPDLVTLLTMARAADRPVLGPSIAEFLDPVPPADLRRAIVAEVPGLLDDLEPDTRNVLLTLARVWVTLATGEIRSKDGAADWAAERLPAGLRPVIERARAIYLGEAEESFAGIEALVEPCAGAMLAAIRALAGPGEP